MGGGHRAAAGEQQVPPLRRRCRSGSGRDDKAFFGGMTGLSWPGVRLESLET